MKAKETVVYTMVIPQKPELEDFGISPADIALYKGDLGDGTQFVIGIVAILGGVTAFGAVIATFMIFFGIDLWLPASICGVIAGACTGQLIFTVLWGLGQIFVKFRRVRLLKRSKEKFEDYENAILVYEQAVAEKKQHDQEVEEKERRERELVEKTRREHEAEERARLRKLVEHWKSLSALDFEREVATLYVQQGYQASLTPRSGDDGIDIILRKDDRLTVVQCKRQQAPAGPSVVRELYGSMVAYKANDAILACTGGFSPGAVEFARGKSIQLISAEGLALMGGDVEHVGGMQRLIKIEAEVRKAAGRKTRIPLCPYCWKKMVSRAGRNGRFWGCSDFPACRGTRNRR